MFSNKAPLIVRQPLVYATAFIARLRSDGLLHPPSSRHHCKNKSQIISCKLYSLLNTLYTIPALIGSATLFAEDKHAACTLFFGIKSEKTIQQHSTIIRPVLLYGVIYER